VAFLVMEYIQGDDLKHHLDRGVRYSLEQSLKIIRDLLSALDYAHKQGIVHRDIKPANLLMEPGGRVKLTDFGVARIQDSGEATRTQGSMVGTLKYMAPEQVQGQKIDSRADLFSVGVVLYQLLTDKRPFDGDNDFSIIHAIIGHEPVAPSAINPRLPGAIDAVVARALAKNRDERFATARDFAVALQAAIRRAEDQTVVPPLNPLKRLEPAGSRPLTVPGTVPGGMTNAPTSGSVTSVTQELELVYWKDVKDSHDAEDLHVFLEKFPSGIYADLARRRLRRLTAPPGEGTNVGTGTFTNLGPMPAGAVDLDATRMRPSDPSRPQGGTIPGGAGYVGTMPGGPAYAGTMPGGPAPAGTPIAPAHAGTTPGGPASVGTLPGAASLRPADWVDQEYTRTPATPPQSPNAAAPPPVPTFQPTAAAAAAPAAPPVAPPPDAGTARTADADPPAMAPRKKPPVAVLAGVGVLVLAGIVLAMTMGRGGQAETAAAEAAASAPMVTASAALAAPGAVPVVAPAVTAPAATAADAAASTTTSAAVTTDDQARAVRAAASQAKRAVPPPAKT
ncbi:MAG: serine/threonine protein kinase, partial [Comamonadaceae bacterium]